MAYAPGTPCEMLAPGHVHCVHGHVADCPIVDGPGYCPPIDGLGRAAGAQGQLEGVTMPNADPHVTAREYRALIASATGGDPRPDLTSAELAHLRDLGLVGGDRDTITVAGMDHVGY